jgi:uncharacterized lipoprotein YajG
MPRVPAAAHLLVLLAMFTLSGCGDDSSSLPTTPTTNPTYVTDSYNGTLNATETGTHPFTAKTPGTITITITTLSPTSTLTMGIGLGTWNGTACNVTLTSSTATQGSSYNASATSAGNFCATIFDIGNITEATNYTLTVTHP